MIEISEDGPQAAEFIESELLKSLRNALPQGENTGFVLSANDPDQGVVAGLTGSTSYGWLLIKTLWVAKEFRRHGLGRSLMERAEDKAREIGCHAAWLDTSNPEAMRFYESLGFEVFARLANSDDQHPSAHCRWFMKKPL